LEALKKMSQPNHEHILADNMQLQTEINRLTSELHTKEQLAIE